VVVGSVSNVLQVHAASICHFLVYISLCFKNTIGGGECLEWRVGVGCHLNQQGQWPGKVVQGKHCPLRATECTKRPSTAGVLKCLPSITQLNCLSCRLTHMESGREITVSGKRKEI
jgi:hypothetical protein